MTISESNLLFALLRAAMCGTPLSDAQREAASTPMLGRLIVLAKQHDIAPLLAVGLEKSGLAAPDGYVENTLMQAVYRYEQLAYMQMEICALLEAAEIPFIPLKGAVIRSLYPEEWMRTSCDVDVLVTESELTHASQVLIAHGYIKKTFTTHDRSFSSPGGQIVELHFSLIEDGLVNQAMPILQTVWDTAKPKEGYRFWHEMRADMAYLYHVAHMAKHVTIGGCGIRPFVDLWLLDKQGVDCQSLLQHSGLDKFAAVAGRLSRVWMSDETPDDATQQLEDYIVRGGVYGTRKNRVAVQQQKAGGRWRYAMSRIFLPYTQLSGLYPIILRYPWLTPMFEVYRWCVLVFGGRWRISMRELAYNREIVGDKAAQAAELLKQLGL